MKPVLVSGIQPTGRLHIGNYLGALKNFVELQNSGKYQCYFFVADLHALTENPDPKDLKKNITNLAADFLAAGLEPKKSVIFQQSQITAHNELMWILNTIAPMGELRRMTQFKDKRHLSALQNVYGKAFGGELSPEEIEESEKDVVAQTKRFVDEEIDKYVNVGLFDYPVLMAADIIMYDAQFVPVGHDQLQHLELARTIARKFNSRFGKTFIEPQPILTKTPRVMSLTDTNKKMSKSQPEGCLFIDDEPEDIKRKISRATTDSGSEIKHDRKNKPGISNLLEIYSSLTDEHVAKIEKKFAGKNYSEFKKFLAGFISDYFADFRKKKKSLAAKPKTLNSVLAASSRKAGMTASKKIADVKKKVGLT
ncbi:MAG: tryptophan--tRNA ligase [Candidatus Liptonbacteria bacterium]|nr:tryptophan--tRNA ligase [Candidatus Liptonbacteria bacterium]